MNTTNIAPQSINLAKQVRNISPNTYCNLCETNAVLSFDHVPPKCVQGDSLNDYWLSRPFDPDSRALHDQGKSKFKTICVTCNNTIGREADHEFLRFIKLIRKWTDGELESGFFNTQQIALSIVSHLLAQDVNFDKNHKSDFQKAAQSVFKNRGKSGMGRYKIYYCLDKKVDEFTIMNDMGMLMNSKLNYKSAIFSMMRLPEISFYITEEPHFFKLPKLNIRARQLFHPPRRIKSSLCANFPLPDPEKRGLVTLLMASENNSATTASPTKIVGPLLTTQKTPLTLRAIPGVSFNVKLFSKGSP